MGAREEALRFLGYRGEADKRTSDLLIKAENELSEKACPMFCKHVLKKAECEQIIVGEDIKNHLSGCDDVIIMAGTLGAETDRLIRAAEITDMAYATVLDAYASAFIEHWMDECEKGLNTEGKAFTWRYSPGYGDYPISLQKEYIKLLSADKRIGLTATENHILIPRKSVTAIVGITENPQPKQKNKCDSCNMKETCRMRKDGSNCGR